MVSKYSQCIVSFCHESTRVTDGQTDRQNYASQHRASLAASCGKTSYSSVPRLTEFVFSCPVCAAADVDDVTAITELRDYHKASPHHQYAVSLSVSERDVNTAVCVQRDADSPDQRGPDSVTVSDTVADVSTQCHHGGGESPVPSKTHQSSVERRLLDAEQSSPGDDVACSHQHSEAINLLLWKLIELERRITLGQVRDVGLGYGNVHRHAYRRYTCI